MQDRDLEPGRVRPRRAGRRLPGDAQRAHHRLRGGSPLLDRRGRDRLEVPTINDSITEGGRGDLAKRIYSEGGCVDFTEYFYPIPQYCGPHL